MLNHPSAVRRHCKWEVQSPLPLGEHVEKHLGALLALLDANAEGVREAIKLYESEISCAIYYHEENGCNVGFNLSENVVARFAEFNLSIDFDLYFLGGDTGSSVSSES